MTLDAALGRFVFHHVGVACVDVDIECSRLAPLGYVPEGAAFVDPLQGVRGRFVTGPGPRLELLQPLVDADHGPLAPWLRHGVKLYHLAYEVPDLADAIATLRAARGKLVAPARPAVAFGGRLIAFVMLHNQLLCELIEQAPS